MGPPPSASQPATTPSSSPSGLQSYWHTPSSPGPSAYDFRSDVVTTPTTSMLRAIEQTTLLDDVFAEDSTTIALESHIASLTGHEAALLVLSGTMGNQVALRTHLQGPPHSILCHHKAHIIVYEAGGVASLSQALVQPVIPANGLYLTLEDVQAHAVTEDNVHYAPTRVISLENTLNGTVTPLAETRRISAWARERGILMHVDGARLWEAVAAGAGGLDEYCACFDSVSLCFSKGLGAPIGSIIVGSRKFIERARWIRKSIGGGTRQAGVIAAAARVAVDEAFGKGPNGEGGKLRESHKMAKEVERRWLAMGGKVARPVETNMVWLDFSSAGISDAEFAEEGAKEEIRVIGGRLVIHWQITTDAVQRLEKAMSKVIGMAKSRGANSARRSGEQAYGQSKL
ncbi:MAG: hypothetical protein Q9227_004213 [Pyrenula ochraceoflavens]